MSVNGDFEVIGALLADAVEMRDCGLPPGSAMMIESNSVE
jgi:hypothetical protein